MSTGKRWDGILASNWPCSLEIVQEMLVDLEEMTRIDSLMEAAELVKDVSPAAAGLLLKATKDAMETMRSRPDLKERIRWGVSVPTREDS